MNMQREIKYLYLLILKKKNSAVDIKSAYEFYSAYEKAYNLLMINPWIPGTTYLPKIKMPKYLKWAKQYIKRDKRTKT